MTNSKSKKCKTITEIKEKLNIIYFFILFLTFTGHLETLFIDLGGMKVLQVSIAYTPCFPTPSLEWLVSFSSPYKQLSARYYISANGGFQIAPPQPITIIFKPHVLQAPVMFTIKPFRSHLMTNWPS